jgi:hypothetical protein
MAGHGPACGAVGSRGVGGLDPITGFELPARLAQEFNLLVD